MKTDDVRLLSSTLLILAGVELAKMRDAEIVGLALGLLGGYLFTRAYLAQKYRDTISKASPHD